MKALLKKLILSTSLLGLLALPALAECPRGDLDKRYCDVNGDLVADAPTDPSKWVDPDTLIFAYTPVEDPAVYKEAWSDFLDHMEKVTGKKVAVKSRSWIMPNSLLSNADGALNPEFDVGEVKASCLPLMSSTLFMPLPG